MGISPDDRPESTGSDTPDTDTRNDSGLRRNEDLDSNLDTAGSGEGDVDPGDDSVDPEDMNIPPADRGR